MSQLTVNELKALCEVAIALGVTATGELPAKFKAVTSGVNGIENSSIELEGTNVKIEKNEAGSFVLVGGNIADATAVIIG